LTKFIRRLQKIGSSILVSLPKEWVDAHNLEKSDQVEIETGQNYISITVNKETKPSKEVEISYPVPKQENIVADITGAYLLGYDLIKIKGRTTIPINDRELIRNSIRRLVGMEIVDEDSSNINVQFLLDATTLNPDKILKRMSSIALGMFNDVNTSLILDDRSNLEALPNRDDEVNRQYFLLVRLIRSIMIDSRLASVFNLENIDVLDYRVAANLIETAGDTIVELGNSILNTSLTKNDLKKLYNIVQDFEKIEIKIIDAFTKNNRKLAIEAITLHRKYKEKTTELRSSLENKKQVPIAYLDLIYMFERVVQSWADIADLVKPIYNE